jgi:8-amino-7-oxononanoate synthase
VGVPVDLAAWLAAERERWDALGLRRELPDPAAGGVDLTSNDYLGLARDPALVAGARDALERFGAGGRASRLLGGGSPLDHEVERACAEWLGAEAALLFPSGYHANLGVVAALAGPGDAVLCDELNHASLIDAVRLSRARAVLYRHGDVEDLERKLALVAGRQRTLVVTESVFSMDGDLAPLGAIADACARHGASLVVDEAHACGLLGPRGAGGWAALGDRRADDPTLAARVVTGGKALGVAGGLVVGREGLRRHLVDRARTLAFTTAAPPPVAGALLAAIRRAAGAEEERAHARGLARRLAGALDLPTPAAAVVPVVLGAARRSMQAAERAREAGLVVRAVRPPTVPEGTSRLRVVTHAFNTEEELERLVDVLRPELEGRVRTAAAAPHARARAIVVAGTDTGIGKTVVSALLARAAARVGPSAYWKPVQTGTESDTEEVVRLAGASVRALAPAHHFALPASPHEAAAAERARVDVEALDAALDQHRGSLPGAVLVAELAGGLLVPWTLETTQLDWLARRRPPVVLVARSGLGTLNHTLLSLEALRARHLEPLALFLVGPPHGSNRETLRALGRVGALYEVPPLEPLDTAALDAWIDVNDLTPLWAGGC